MVLKMCPNHEGRDFIVGDIHGEFRLLEQALEGVGFDPERDRLIATGDLVDRGPDSPRVMEFLRQPWFFSVQGNHDQMPALALHALAHRDDEVLRAWHKSGGTWGEDVPASQLEDIAAALAKLPVMIEVPTPNGTIGVCHAEPPIGADWLDLRRRLHMGCEHTRRHLTWSRERMTALGKREVQEIPHEEWAVSNIDHVFCGHTVVDRWMTLGNLHFIDTGGCFDGGELTTIEITARGFRERTYQRARHGDPGHFKTAA